MNQALYLENEAARRLYGEAARLPVVDYHCHLSPREIYEDREFSNIAQMWLSGDHYKWRLMRAFGIDERFITGDAPDAEKFQKYAECVSLAAGNPLRVWSEMELALYFHIDTPLSGSTAPEIWERANAVIREERLSPRKLIRQANVEWIVTTDDPADSLEFHRLIAADDSFQTKVIPAFRPDKLLNLRAPDWCGYIETLSARAGVEIDSLDSLEQAVRLRLDAFCELGCRLSDVGIEAFPSGRCSREEAAHTFRYAREGGETSEEKYRAFLHYMYVFLAGEYRRRGIAMQYHLAVKRNANSALFRQVGPDAGGDCVGDPIPQGDVVGLLDEIDGACGMPRTILYTLNPSMYLTLATAAGSFRGVTLGAAWWYNDHRAGIEEQLRVYAQVSHLGTFTGMLTDSRSFLSYARHDYFRRIFCNLLGGWIEAGELDGETARELVRRVCYGNSLELVR